MVEADGPVVVVADLVVLVVAVAEAVEPVVVGNIPKR